MRRLKRPSSSSVTASAREKENEAGCWVGLCHGFSSVEREFPFGRNKQLPLIQFIPSLNSLWAYAGTKALLVLVLPSLPLLTWFYHRSKTGCSVGPRVQRDVSAEVRENTLARLNDR